MALPPALYLELMTKLLKLKIIHRCCCSWFHSDTSQHNKACFLSELSVLELESTSLRGFKYKHFSWLRWTFYLNIIRIAMNFKIIISGTSFFWYKVTTYYSDQMLQCYKKAQVWWKHYFKYQERLLPCIVMTYIAKHNVCWNNCSMTFSCFTF